MIKLELSIVKDYVNQNISRFHESRIKCLEELSLKTILKKKNPYLFKAKNINIASDLIRDLLDAYLSSSEEKLFGNFLENFAIFVSSQTCNGRKSAATGIDLEFENNDTFYLVSIKSGPNWGNSSQQNRQEEDIKRAVRVIKQSGHNVNVQPVLGICYGKTRTTFVRNYMKVVGQNFWYFISEDENLYTDIIKPLGYKARKHNNYFIERKEQLINIFTEELLREFCIRGTINWKKVVEFNSGNLDLKK